MPAMLSMVQVPHRGISDGKSFREDHFPSVLFAIAASHDDENNRKYLYLRSQMYCDTIMYMSSRRVPFMDIVATYSDAPHRRLVDLRPDGLAELPAFGRLSYTKARPDLPIHRHFGSLEVHYRDRGEQHFQLGEEIHHLQGGDLFLTLPDEPHSSGGYPLETGIMYWFVLRLPPKGKGLLGLPLRESRAILQHLLNPPCRSFRATGRTKPLFAEILKLHYNRETFLRTVRMRQAMIRLLLEIIESAQRHVGSPASGRMAETIRMIQDHPQAEHRLRDLARRTHLSVSRFKSRFKAETGISPWQFILNARIEAAKKRLAVEGDFITKIAVDLGFSSSQHFAAAFKRITGVTPRAYRCGTVLHGPSTRSDDGQD
jgi:AraC-like DNA-binding protein